MRLAAKLVLVIVLCMIAALAVDGMIQIRREGTLFETDMRRDHRILGQALRAAIEASWVRDGPRAAKALVDRVGREESAVHARWVRLEATGGDPDAPRLPSSALEPLERGEEVFRVEPSARGAGNAFTYVPLDIPHVPRGALELTESLEDERRFTNATRVKAFGLATATAVLFGFLAMGLGVVLVGRPVSRLVDQARRVGQGDLTTRLAPREHDEISELAREMNVMCDRLEAANRQAAEAASARIAMLEQLRHADRLRTVGTLASGIAHELGTPLQVARGRGKMIATGEARDAAAAECGRIVVEQCERMTRIIRHLLDFARRRDPRPEEEDLRSVASRTAVLLAPLASKRGVTIELALGEEPAVARVDPDLIQQALANLVVNGVDAMPTGGSLSIAVTRSTRQPPDEIDGSGRSWWCLDVLDHGAGMPEEILARAFEPFFTTKGVGEGTGLGLSVTYGIVEEHGGWIDARSDVGAGSCFTIHLPAASSA